MPTSHPRYTLTDTGRVREMLDAAQRQWPEVENRKELLIRLAERGSEQIGRALDEQDAVARSRRQQAAMRRVGQLVDVDLLLADDAWR
jgi:hypothetical protein